MTNITLSIADDFSDAPGARNYDDGPDSGEEFFDKCLQPKFVEAREAGVSLIVDMDGTFGYATSFISEAFGRLSKKYGVHDVLEMLEIVSDEDPDIKEYTIKTIMDPDAR